MQLRPEQLEGRLKTLAPIYLLSGDEPLQVQECVTLLRQAAQRHGFHERQVLTVDKPFDWGQLHSFAASLSLFAERRVLELRFGTHKPDAEAGKALLAYAERPPEDVLLLITCPRLDSAAQKSRWFTHCEQQGVVITSRPLDAKQLPDWLQRRAQRLGLQLEREALSLLCERLEGNLLAAANVLELLALLYPHGGRLSWEQLANAIGDSARYSVFDLADAALEGQSARVLRILTGLEEEGCEPLVMLWALSRELRTLQSVLQAQASGIAVEQALQQAKVWDKRKPLYRRAVNQLTLGRCQRLMAQAAALDRSLKGLEPGLSAVQLRALALGLAGAKTNWM